MPRIYENHLLQQVYRVIFALRKCRLPFSLYNSKYNIGINQNFIAASDLELGVISDIQSGKVGCYVMLGALGEDVNQKHLFSD